MKTSTAGRLFLIASGGDCNKNVAKALLEGVAPLSGR